MRNFIISALAAFAIMTSLANASTSLSERDRILLQVTMQTSIDRHLIDGQFLYFDRKAATVHALYPAKTHPMVIKMGERYVLCTDFRKSDGSSVNVDFYMARQGNGFTIFDTIVDNRVPLQKLIKNGTAWIVK